MAEIWGCLCWKSHFLFQLITKEIKGKEHWLCLTQKGQDTYNEIINILLDVEKTLKKDVAQQVITNYLNASEELAKILDDPLMK